MQETMALLKGSDSALSIIDGESGQAVCECMIANGPENGPLDII